MFQHTQLKSRRRVGEEDFVAVELGVRTTERPTVPAGPKAEEQLPSGVLSGVPHEAGERHEQQSTKRRGTTRENGQRGRTDENGTTRELREG